MSDYFAVFGLPRKLQVDGEALQRRFYELSRRHHPDFHQGAGEDEQAEALADSALINRAYRALRDPLARVEYLSRSRRAGRREGAPPSPPSPRDLLEEMMEVQEALEEAKDAGLDEAARERLREERGAARRAPRGDGGGHRGARAPSGTRPSTQGGDRAPLLAWFKQRLATRAYLRTVIDDLSQALGRGPGRACLASSALTSGPPTASSPTWTGRHPQGDPRRRGTRPAAVDRGVHPGRRRGGRGGAAPARPQCRADRLLGEAPHGPRLRGRSRTSSAHFPFEVVPSAEVVRIRVGDREVTPPEVSAHVLRALKARAEALLRRAGRAGRDHRARLLQRRPAPGDQGRRAHRRARGAAHRQRAHGRLARLRAAEGCPRGPSRSTTWAAAPSTSRSCASRTASSRCSPPTATRTWAATTSTGRWSNGCSPTSRPRTAWISPPTPRRMQELRLAAEAAKCRLSFDERTVAHHPVRGLHVPARDRPRAISRR